MAPRDPARLASYVKTRRLNLGLARKTAAEHAGMSKDTWKRIEEGGSVREMSYAKVDPVLGWAPGSCIAVLGGREPILSKPAETPADADISRVPDEDLGDRARKVIQLATIATTSGLTADEIRELSDRAVQDLRANGII